MEGKILIVDDERTVIQQVKTLLDGFGYKSGFIPKADFLFKRLDSGPVDLILLDINMPGIDGITMLKRLKEHTEYSKIPVIMMTGDTNAETLQTCFTYGAADYITKPIGELILKSRVKSVIESREYIHKIQTQHEMLLQRMEEIQL